MKDFRLTGFRFNIFLGLISCFGFPALNPDIPLEDPPWWVAIVGILFYVGEMWAFNYKIHISRARILRGLTKNTPGMLSVDTRTPGCMIFYAFLIRFCLRFAMLMIIGAAMGLTLQDEDPSIWVILLMIFGCLFEIVVFLFSLFWSRVYKTEAKNEREQESENDEEVAWRKKYFPWLDDPKHPMKEMAADIILFIFAVLLTKGFWDTSNADFIDFIRRSSTDGTSAAYVCVSIIIANIVLCLFFLIPVRLAYWVEESMLVFTGRDRWRYALSMIFAGLMVTAPSWMELFRVYF